MEDYTKRYKYSCRDCSIRQRCIDDKSLGPGIKLTIARTFANRTDTLETWEMLQQDCLLVRQERQKAAGTVRPESGLIRRLRQARQPPDEPPPVKPTPAPPRAKRKPTAPAPFAPRPPSFPSEETPCGITVLATQRMVRLPDEGEVVLGRFEHGFANSPDVDLALDDGEIPSVSRRHALVIGKRGQHWIEDMGSANGTYLNGNKLPLGKSTQLAPGDRILLGRCRLTYTPVPTWALEPDSHMPHTCILVVTHTGYELELPQKREIMVGRPDPSVGFIPDVDLSAAGDMAMYVSRRHARIITRGNWHFLEEVGSAAGTRLNGRLIQVGDSPALMHPGDQLWLGGCVVAYEWRLL
jgi:pSer/pThr/pTyr-binding forkhead associated (FHA) protein